MMILKDRNRRLAFQFGRQSGIRSTSRLLKNAVSWAELSVF
jgi:hypothetical protein